MAGVHVLELPCEILDQIISEVRGSLKRVSCVCRTFRVLCEPRIWSHVSLKGSQASSLPALVKYWHLRTEIAAYVLDLNVDWERINRKKEKIKSEDVAELQIIVKSLNLDLPENWHTLTENLSILAGIAILQARNVRQLSITADKKSEYFFKALPFPEETSTRLRNLTDLRFVASQTGTWPVLLDQIFPLMKLAPFIKSFYGINTCGKFEGMDWSRIAKLKLARRGVIPVEDTPRWIKSCGRLEEFDLWALTDYDDLEDILPALTFHGESLKVLKLDIGGWGDTAMRLRSFTKLPSLESLKITADELGFGSDCLLRELQPSLKHLKISGYIDGYKEEFVWFAKEVEGGKFPDLRTISFTEWECDGDHENSCRLVNSESWEGGEVGCDMGQTLCDVREMFSALGVTDPTPWDNPWENDCTPRELMYHLLLEDAINP
ncbi:hypothetical protein CGCSCA1_v000822 [Colletotrichum siamense]|nr:hypothetical protein CGCSCA1_v000822 [Colletotrichum siamense]